MKISIFGKAFLLMLLSVFTFYSCEKEEWQQKNAATFDQSISSERPAFDEFGAKLELAVSNVIEKPAFKNAVIEMTDRMEDGDYEVLFTSLLEEHKDLQTLLLANNGRAFTATELDDFLIENPSMILAVRGPSDSWKAGQHSPAVVFVPSTFKEKNKSIVGAKAGVPVDVPLDNSFREAVITIAISERHDRSGTLITDQYDIEADAQGNLRKSKASPSIDLSGNIGGLKSSCTEPEPTACPEKELDLNYFTVAPWNGGFEIAYNFHNTEAAYNSSWFMVTITRLNPDGSTTKFYRYCATDDLFYDFDVNPNLTYVYQLEARLGYLSNDAGGWVVCSEVTALASEDAPPAGPIVNSFIGHNFSSSSIYYSWSPPQAGSNPIPVFEYKLSYWNGSTFVEEAILGGDATSYEFNYPASDQGQKVRMMIQYRAGGGEFQGNFHDITYGSYRDDGLPLYFLGMNLTSPWLYEQSSKGENPLYGNPEFRIIAYQGGANTSSQLIMAVVRTTLRCPGTNFFKPITSVNIAYWSRDLITSGITVRVWETDVLEPIIDESSSIETVEGSFEANVGYKAPLANNENGEDPPTGTGSEAQIGIQSSWKNGTAVTYRYPTEDIPLGVFPLYYHETLFIQRGNTLFSTVVDNSCTVAVETYY